MRDCLQYSRSRFHHNGRWLCVGYADIECSVSPFRLPHGLVQSSVGTLGSQFTDVRLHTSDDRHLHR
jgi:hypothetical protein